MWYYVKTLEYPINLKSCDLNMAKLIITQYGGPDGELGAALRYLNQRYTMPTNKSKGLLTDIGTEEQAHLCCKYIIIHKIRAYWNNSICSYLLNNIFCFTIYFS